MNSLNSSVTWQALAAKSAEFKTPDFSLKALFAESERYARFSVVQEGLLLDYSKNLLDAEARTLLIRLAEERQLKQAIQALFAGEIINKTEQRPAHHVACACRKSNRPTAKSAQHSAKCQPWLKKFTPATGRDTQAGK